MTARSPTEIAAEALRRIADAFTVQPGMASVHLPLAEIHSIAVEALAALTAIPVPERRERLAKRLEDAVRYSRQMDGIVPADLIAEAALALRQPVATEASDHERERCAKIADKHRARIPNHNPDDQSGDLVAHGYGNAALNIAHEIRSLSRLSHPATGEAWRPIVEAPKDGTSILVYYEFATVPIAHIAHWDDGENWNDCGFDSQAEAAGWWAYVENSVSQHKLSEFNTPTHWQPLREPLK